MQRAVENLHDGGDFPAGLGKGVFRRRKLVDEGIRNHLKAAQAVIEHQQRVRQHEHRIRNP